MPDLPWLDQAPRGVFLACLLRQLAALAEDRPSGGEHGDQHPPGQDHTGRNHPAKGARPGVHAQLAAAAPDGGGAGRQGQDGPAGPATDRPDPIALLEEQAASRVADLIPIRYGRMLVSPFTFYRGAALIMAADLAATPRSGLTVQACGDAHLSNFGVFASPERNLIFDINDFDETLPGPWEWDVKRLAASFEIMGRDRGFAPADRRAIVMAGVAEYRERMRQAAGMGTLGAWYDQLEAGVLLNLVRQETRVKRVSKKEAQAFERDVQQAQTRDSTRVFAKRAGTIEGELRIVADPPVIVPI